LHSFCRLFEHGQSQRADIDGAPEVTVSARNQPAPSKTVPSSCVMLQAEQARQFYSEHHGKNFFNKKIEAQLEKWGVNTIEKQTVSLDEARARELAMSWGAERSYEFDPDEDEGSFLMPYNLRPHPAEWDEPPLEKKPEGEEGEEEPPPPEEGEGETEEVPPEPVCTETMPYDVRKMVGILTSGECTVYLLSRYGAVHALQTLTGPQEPAVARFHETTAGTLRAHYGASRHNFAVHASASAILTRKEIKLFFPERDEGQLTLAIIKPDAVRATTVTSGAPSKGEVADMEARAK